MEALLDELGLAQYLSTFIDEEITDPSLLRAMKPEVLLDELQALSPLRTNHSRS